MKKVRVAVLYGGRSTEHEVSIVSARSVISNLDPEKYQILPVYITKTNQWLAPTSLPSGQSNDPRMLHDQAVHSLAQPPQAIAEQSVDVFFPILHGPNGEDGTVQGLLELLNVPYVGCGVLASAICMDKSTQKKLCREAGIPTVPFVEINLKQWQDHQASQLHTFLDQVRYPVFIKPSNQGSSVGVTKADNQKQVLAGINQAFQYDHRILVEQGIVPAREIECAVLGSNNSPKASVLGEIIASNDFYDYDAKYIDGQSQAVIPASLDPLLTEKIQDTAKKAFTICQCYGLARVDFLVDRGGEYYLSELNTLPGFTSISMYPTLWQKSGLNYPKLLERLIDLALERYHQKQTIKLSYQPKTNWHQ